MKSIIFTIILFSFSHLFSQDLEGKWMLTSEGETYISPENQILEIGSDSITLYKLNTFHSRSANNLVERNKNENKIEPHQFKFIDSNRLIIYMSNLENGSVTPLEYVRLLPTKTSLSKEEIEALSFNFNWNEENIKIRFNEYTYPKLAKNIDSSLIPKIQLEKIDDTYFASLFVKDKRDRIIPIQEITSKKMTIYGFPREPYFVTGNVEVKK